MNCRVPAEAGELLINSQRTPNHLTTDMATVAGALHPQAELHAAQQRRHSIRLLIYRAIHNNERAAGLVNSQRRDIREAIQAEADLLRRALAVLNGDD